MKTVTETPTATQRPEPPKGRTRIKWIIALAIIIPFIWAMIGLEISLRRLLEAPGDIWNLLGVMFPPDWSAIGRTFEKILESLYVAWVGTIIGAFFSFPLGFMAATNITPRWIATPSRAILSAIRAFPELVLAIILIPAFGLGPFAATLAIGLHSVGTLGKLTSEVIEGIDEGPLEAIQASGGTKALQMRFGVVPQAMPTIIAYWLYRFEINIRASAVLGVIGAGGVGAELVGRLRFRADWPKAGTVLIVLIITVLVIDSISGAVRRRIISGQPAHGPIASVLKLFNGKPSKAPSQ